MKNSTRLLTIAIPTYNRATNLEKLLSQLFEEDLQDAEILISNDASHDKTEAMLKKYQNRSELRIVHQKHNIGFNANICALYQLSNTRYIWFLCDDDSIYTGAVARVKKALKTYEPVVSVFSTTWIDPFGKKRIAGVPSDKLYTKHDEFDSYQPLMRTTFLSIVVIEKRKDIDELIETDYKNNIFFQLSVSLYLLSDKLRFLEFHSSPVVHRNVGYKYGEFFKFYLVDHLKAIESIPNSFDFEKFKKWSQLQIPSALQLYLSQKLGLYQYHGSPSKETSLLLRKYYGIYSQLFRLFPLISFLIPTFILKFAYIMILISFHGWKKGSEIYRNNINRASKDERQTGFTTYR